MRLRELKFPILIRYPNELQAGKAAGLSKPSGRFNFAWTVSFEDGSYDEAEVIDSEGQVYRIEKILFLRPTILERFMDRLGNLFIFNRYDPSEIANVDMELVPVRRLTLGQFKKEYLELILAHPSWWKRHASRSRVEKLFSEAKSFSEAFDEIGWWLTPSYNMVYRGKSKKIVDLR